MKLHQFKNPEIEGHSQSGVSNNTGAMSLPSDGILIFKVAPHENKAIVPLGPITLESQVLSLLLELLSTLVSRH